MKHILLLAGAAAALSFAVRAEALDIPLETWEFRRPGETWRALSVPHDWAIAGPFDRKHDLQVTAIVQDGEKRAEEKTGRTGALPWIGTGEYRRRIVLPADAKWASLVFDGAMSEPKVFFDGRPVGEWKNGYNAFEVELPPEPGDHEIRVTLENRPRSSRWYPGAGLFRPVRLRAGAAAGIRTWGVSLYSPDLETVRVAVECRGAVAKVVHTVWDGDRVLARAEDAQPGAGRATDLRADFAPWSPESPKLYTLVTEAFDAAGVRVDTCTRRFGVRTLAYGPDGFALNGVRRKFRGVCLHHDLGPLGAAFDPDAFRRQITLLKEMGCDALRTAHNMPGEGQLDICDELGMLVMAESFDSWASAKTENGYNLFFTDWWKRDLENLVRKCRSHPSVVMWSIGNEVNEQTSPDGARISRELQAWCHRFDPDPARKVTQGLSWMPQAITNGLNAVMEIPGVTYRLPFYEAMYKDTKTGLVLGAETASTVSSRGEYFFPVKAGKGVTHPNGQSSGYDVECCPWSNLPDDDWAMQEDKPWTIGEFVWTGFDYLGEPTPYNSFWPSRSSYFGIFDLAGLPKDRYWLYRSHWNTSSPTLHLVPHWTFPGREGKVTPVYCYTSYDEAELFVNGQSQGRRRKDRASRLDRFRLRWNEVTYEPGELKVVAYGADGRVAATETVRTAGAAAGVRLEKRRFGRLLFVTATVVDAAGTPVPDATDGLAFAARGDLRFKAVCNGDATSLESFQRPRMNAFHGQAVAIFEGTGDDVTCTRTPYRRAPEGHVERVVARILENVAKVRAADPEAVPMAFWDFDGTIIRGDLGYGLTENGVVRYHGLLEEIIRAGWIPIYRQPDGYERWFKDYTRMGEVGHWLSQSYDAQMFTGVSVRELDAFCERTIREKKLDRWYFASSMAIWKALAAAGVENCVVSASIEPMMRNVASTLGIPKERVRATRVEEECGRWTTKLLQPVPYGEGKVDAVRMFLKARAKGVAVAAFGNSYATDAAFLRYVATQPALPGGAKGTALMINGGKAVSGYTEFFICVSQEAVVGADL